jgi:hypothetical protein
MVASWVEVFLNKTRFWINIGVILLDRATAAFFGCRSIKVVEIPYSRGGERCRKRKEEGEV